MLVRLQYASDLHLDNPANRKFIKGGGLKPEGDCLVLAGDVAELNALENFAWFWDWCAASYRQTWIVPGNHEFYGCARKWLRRDSFEVVVRDNVRYCSNLVVHEQGVRFVFSTLWSCVTDPVQRVAIQKQVCDYKEIRLGERAVTVDEINTLHAEARRFLEEALAEGDSGSTVVATHHVPLLELTPVRYADSLVRQAFIADCGDLVRRFAPAYWIYGHSHVSGGMTVGTSRVLSNQLGTVRPNKRLDFSAAALIEL